MENLKVIIVAGGKGERMQSKLPKQFIEIACKPIIIHTIQKFLQFKNDIEICVVINAHYKAMFNNLLEKHQLNTFNITCVDGGESRFHSVKNGIDSFKDFNGVIAIHDAVRPCLSTQLINNGFKATETHKAIIPVIPLKDSIRKKQDNSTTAVNRDDFCLVQTPQFYNATLLKQAYSQNYNPRFTDSASVVESLGFKVSTVEGETSNVKITTQIDLSIAEFIIQQQLPY